MIRDVAQLTRRTFDILVVGGGVYGLTIAYDAAQRGLSVGLVERADFGSGSSFNHLRTIHGGLRYLQTLDLARARESILERRTLARIAPHAVKPLPFVLPLSRSLTKGPAAARIGLLLDWLLGRDRNAGLSPPTVVPAGAVVSRAEVLERFPDLGECLAAVGFEHALVWYDYVTPESDRLTLAWALAGSACGAVLTNYMEASALLVDRGRAVGVRATDRETGRDLEIGARIVVNAAGGSVNTLLEQAGLRVGQPLLKAMNVVTRRTAGSAACAGATPSGRSLFSVPWRGATLFGTWESGRAVKDRDTAVTETEVAGFLDDLNRAFPALRLGRDDVSLVHRGLVPAALRADGTASLEAHEQIRGPDAEGLAGLISVAGTKYTTARGVAERVTDRVLAALRLEPVACRTATAPLPGGDMPDVDQALGAASRTYTGMLPANVIEHLVRAYGTGCSSIAELARGCLDWQVPLSETSPVIGAELIWAVRREMALTLNDAVIRRTPLGALGRPGDAAAARAADIVGKELRWTDERTSVEVAALRDFYRIG